MGDEKKPTHRDKLPKAQIALRSTTRWIAERAARAEARARDLEFAEAFLATPGPSSSPATPIETRSEFMQENSSEFYAAAVYRQLESALPSTGSVSDIPAFESTYKLPRSHTPLRSTTLRIAEEAARGTRRFSRSFVIPLPPTPYETLSEIMPVNRPRFNPGVAKPLESAEPSTELILDIPSSEDSDLEAVQQPGASENLEIRPQLGSTPLRSQIVMQANPKNTPSADGSSESK